MIAKQSTKIDFLSQQVKLVQQQLGHIMEFMKGKRDSEENIEKVITTTIEEAVDDSKEREEKKNNLIMFNVTESTKDDLKEENDEDMTQIKNIMKECNHLVPLDGTFTMTRLGKNKSKRSEDRPRAIKVTFEKGDHKWKILSNSGKLRSTNAFSKVNLSTDKTEKEKQTDRKLKTELENKKRLTGLDYTIFANEIMIRTGIPQFEKDR